jgi:exodeoxyribonuclease VII small subunit
MSKPAANFNKELKELEAIVEWFESDSVDLDAALPKFERGMELAAKLKQHLEQVENKIEVIKKKFDAPNTAE